MGDACRNVVEQQDLLAEIFNNMEIDLPCDPPPPLNQEFRMGVILIIKRLYALETVCHAFRSACFAWRDSLWKRAREELREFNEMACHLIDQPSDDGSWTRPLGTRRILDIYYMEQRREWARSLYNFDVKRVWVEDLQRNLQHAVLHLPPSNFEEMVFYLEGKCACCNGGCELYGSGWHGHEVAGPPDRCEPYGAFLNHPYRGVMVSHGSMACGCTRQSLIGAWLPHTHFDHFARVLFVNDNGLMTAKVLPHYDKAVLSGYQYMTKQELEVHNFLIGMRRTNTNFYALRIRRLFGLRSPLLALNQCCVRTWGVRAHHRSDYQEFEADVCLFEPRMPDNEDRSMQQIFDLSSRKEVLTMIRRGRAQRREQWLLS